MSVAVREPVAAQLARYLGPEQAQAACEGLPVAAGTAEEAALQVAATLTGAGVPFTVQHAVFIRALGVVVGAGFAPPEGQEPGPECPWCHGTWHHGPNCPGPALGRGPSS